MKNTEQRFSPGELERFLREVDQRLAAPAAIVIIGGSAIGLNYRPSHASRDLDYASASAEVEAVFDEARRATGLPIPTQRVGVFDAPHTYEDRLQERHIEGLRWLQVFVPERHDLVIMKVARGDEHDLQAIEDLHKESPLELEVLKARFRETDFVGHLPDKLLNFFAAVARLFGEDAAANTEAELSGKTTRVE